MIKNDENNIYSDIIMDKLKSYGNGNVFFIEDIEEKKEIKDIVNSYISIFIKKDLK